MRCPDHGGREIVLRDFQFRLRCEDRRVVETFGTELRVRTLQIRATAIALAGFLGGASSLATRGAGSGTDSLVAWGKLRAGAGSAGSFTASSSDVGLPFSPIGCFLWISESMAQNNVIVTWSAPDSARRRPLPAIVPGYTTHQLIRTNAQAAHPRSVKLLQATT